MLAIERIKLGSGDLPSPSDFTRAMRQMHADKEFPTSDLLPSIKSGIFGTLFDSLLMRHDTAAISIGITNYVAAHAFQQHRVAPRVAPQYKGTIEENAKIDSAFYRGGRDIGIGASNTHKITSPMATAVNSLSPTIQSTPIAIIGLGPAGAMVWHSLNNLGFSNITAFEAKSFGGIWNIPGVRSRSRNNPRPIIFQSATLTAAPGGGEEVYQFVTKLLEFANTNSKILNPNNVVRIDSRPFQHTLTIINSQRTYPIVINCMGLGHPKPLDDPSRMRSPGPNIGERWQTLLTEKDRGKNMVFIGLGNSTMEMIVQIEEAKLNCPYKILTHYPKKAIENPNETFIENNKRYRVFRDLSLPNLTSVTGDLPAIRSAYFKALHENRIIPSVKEWKANEREMILPHQFYAYDRLFCLIGYGWNKTELLKYSAAGGNDYDGEFRNNGDILKGYFGFGAILENELNKNAVVIPGMVYRINDLLYGVIMRAFEYQLREARK